MVSVSRKYDAFNSRVFDLFSNRVRFLLKVDFGFHEYNKNGCKIVVTLKIK